MNYVGFALRNGTTGSNGSTNSYICSVTDSTNDCTTDVAITSSATIHPISSGTPTDTSDATNTTYTVIISSLAGGILVVFFMVCIIVLLLKGKLYRRHKNNDNFTLSPTDSLLNR